MLRFAAKRAAWAAFVLIVVITLVFVVVHRIGDPCRAQLGENARAEQITSCRETYGFDQPLAVQYTSYIGLTSCLRHTSPAWNENPDRRGHCGVLQGELGESMSFQEDVTSVILTRLPRTLLLGGMAMGFELLIGLTIGIIAATRRNTWLDTGVMATAFLGISAPTFLTGLLFLYAFAFTLGWFPVGGYGATPWEHVYSAVLPAFTLAIIGAATYARIMRSEMVDALRSDYIRTARAKGAHPVAVVLRHGARNALLPIVTLMGLQMAIIVSGAIITEQIYAWPGVGRLAIEAIHKLDAPTIMGIVVMVSATVQLGNFLADIAVGALDPRVRVDGS